jgi:hypothetical protein
MSKIEIYLIRLIQIAGTWYYPISGYDYEGEPDGRCSTDDLVPFLDNSGFTEVSVWVEL